jgi:hypothetical protein
MGPGSGNGATGGTILPVSGLGLGFGTGSPPLTGDAPTFVCPRRPNIGRDGRPILLRANHFQISMPRGYINHYQINIQPDKCPRCPFRESQSKIYTLNRYCFFRQNSDKHGCQMVHIFSNQKALFG